MSAFYELEAFTCLRFRLRIKEENFLSFVDLGGCWSYVGKVGGKQMVSLGKGCKTKGKATHEILHAIGFVHEHQRPGRDEFIQVIVENIDKRCGVDGISSCLPNFQTINPDFLNYRGVFDEHSVMHYDGFSFAKSPIARHPTIVNVDTLHPVQSQRLQASIFDLEKICDMYNCPMNNLPYCHSEKFSKTQLSRQCNGIIDCLDSSDELNCHACKTSAIKCFSMNQCILQSQVCDGYKHCTDGSDEFYCDQNCSREYRMSIDNRLYQFRQTEKFKYELSNDPSSRLNLTMTQTDSYWLIQNGDEDLVAFSLKQNKNDCPQNNLWRFKTVSSWLKTEMINMMKPVLGYIGPADRINAVLPTSDDSIIFHQAFLERSEKVRSLMILLNRIPLHHNGCKVYVYIDLTIDEKYRMDIMGKLKQTQCLLVTVDSSLGRRHTREWNFDDFEMIGDNTRTSFYEAARQDFESEELEYEEPLVRSISQGYLTAIEDISNSICNGMHRQHLSGTYDKTSGQFSMHQKEACIESNDCWDSDLSFCFCEISSKQPSCLFEVPDVPNLPESKLSMRRLNKTKKSKKNKRAKKRKYENISTTSSVTTIASTAFSTTSATTSNFLSRPKSFGSFVSESKLSFTSKNNSLNCYKCTAKVCNETEKCSHGQICFTEVRRRGSIITQRQGGCKETRACLTQAKQSRKWCKPNNNSGSYNWSWCYHCCSQNHCNKNT